MKIIAIDEDVWAERENEVSYVLRRYILTEEGNSKISKSGLPVGLSPHTEEQMKKDIDIEPSVLYQFTNFNGKVQTVYDNSWNKNLWITQQEGSPVYVYDNAHSTHGLFPYRESLYKYKTHEEWHNNAIKSGLIKVL